MDGNDDDKNLAQEEAAPELALDRERFEIWYNDYSERFLSPGALQVQRCLSELLDSRFSGRDRDRYRLSAPRTKTKNRLFQKLERDKYSVQVKVVEDVPRVIDDLLGIRITCTNEIDVERLKEALEEQVKVSEYGDGVTAAVSFAIESDSERDSRLKPRDSGYRALHYNLLTPVPVASGSWEMVRCELQVRTLLQDSWGELTHEDTYKPGAEVSDLVETLSRRMADMFAVMDSLAQDLRGELDRVAASAAGDLPTERGISPDHDRAAHVEGAQTPSVIKTQELAAVQRYLRDRWEGLKQPLHLASLAWELQGEFGSDVKDGWLGYQRMVDLLKSSVPATAVVTEAPGLLVPAGFTANTGLEEDDDSGSLPEGVPHIARRIKSYDSDFPLLDTNTLSQAYSFLAEAHNAQRGQYGEPDVRYLNLVTRLARDLALGAECTVGRGALNYIGYSLLLAGAFKGHLTHDMVARVFTESAVRRLNSVGSGPDANSERDREELRNWLRVLDGSGYEPT